MLCLLILTVEKYNKHKRAKHIKKKKNQRETKKEMWKIVEIYDLCGNLEIDSISLCKRFVCQYMKIIRENLLWLPLFFFIATQHHYFLWKFIRTEHFALSVSFTFSLFLPPRACMSVCVCLCVYLFYIYYYLCGEKFEFNALCLLSKCSTRLLMRKDRYLVVHRLL